ncbi:MAG: branched-chain amino acid transport system ATP-binding protein [Chloroflexi bacterium]|jgi:ABC-type branched-subunit amino acid transport system ATPase component|nr:MAG: branched-chain amino acid transport system ATP-binding protein [Chloroflexota bacterium]
MATLEVQGVGKSFGGYTALEDIGLSLDAGSIMGVIGPNGAGKSTLINIISGFLKPDTGTVKINGKDITGKAPYRVFKSGIARTFQDSQVFGYMTGLENVMVSAPWGIGVQEYNVLARPFAVAREEKQKREEAMAHLAQVNITDKARSMAQALSYGQQKLLEFARMLNSRANVFLLDEPMAGIHPDLVDGLKALIVAMAKEHNKAVILVEHNLKVVMEMSDYVTVIRNSVLLSGTPDAVSKDERLAGAFLGVTDATA